ncbi:hypothetical protein FRC17_007062, partial [Serendipita sp. 399]
MTTRMDESFSSFEQDGPFDMTALTAPAGWPDATMRMTMDDDVDLVDLDLGHLYHHHQQQQQHLQQQKQQYIVTSQDRTVPGFLDYGGRGGPLPPAIPTHSASSSFSTASSSSSSSLSSTSSRASPALVPTTPALYGAYDVGSGHNAGGMPISTANTPSLNSYYPYLLQQHDARTSSSSPHLSGPSPFCTDNATRMTAASSTIDHNYPHQHLHHYPNSNHHLQHRQNLTYFDGDLASTSPSAYPYSYPPNGGVNPTTLMTPYQQQHSHWDATGYATTAEGGSGIMVGSAEYQRVGLAFVPATWNASQMQMQTPAPAQTAINASTPFVSIASSSGATQSPPPLLPTESQLLYTPFSADVYLPPPPSSPVPEWCSTSSSPYTGAAVSSAALTTMVTMTGSPTSIKVEEPSSPSEGEDEEITMNGESLYSEEEDPLYGGDDRRSSLKREETMKASSMAITRTTTTSTAGSSPALSSSLSPPASSSSLSLPSTWEGSPELTEAYERLLDCVRMESERPISHDLLDLFLEVKRFEGVNENGMMPMRLIVVGPPLSASPITLEQQRGGGEDEALEDGGEGKRGKKKRGRTVG